MSRFYGSIEGSAKTAATRQGTTHTGFFAHIRGWFVGVKVIIPRGLPEGEDRLDIYTTGGSAGPGGTNFIGSVKLIDDNPTFIPKGGKAT